MKNDNGAFPLRIKPGEKTLILFADSCASRAVTGATPIVFGAYPEE